MSKKYNRIVTINLDTEEEYAVHFIESNKKVIGSNLITPETEKRNKAFTKSLMNEHKVDELRKYLNKNVGEFFFLIYDYATPFMSSIYNELEGNNANIYIIRFIQLATCINTKNNLENKHHHKVKKTDLKNIWNISNRNDINKTYDLLLKYGYIKTDDNGYISLNNDVVFKGKIKSKIKELKKMNKNITYTRVFEENIKNLYENAKPTERKQLANFFKILPFVNYKYNVICSNPSETEEEKIIPLVWSEIAMICGYDISKISRFRNNLSKFEINNKSVIGTFTDSKGQYISINPNLYYSGSNVEDVEFLSRLFDFNDKLGTKTKRRSRQKN